MSETHEGESVMRSLTFRLIIALLTFIVGVSAAGLWLYHRSSVNNSRAIQGQQSAGEKRVTDQTARTKWIYLATPHPIRYGDPALASIIALYADGEWLQTDFEVERKKGKLELSYFNHASMASGTWRQEINGEVTAMLDNCWSSAESIPLNGGHQAEYPVATHWSFTNGTLGQAASILHIANEDLHLLQTNQLTADGKDALLDAYRAFRNQSQSGGRICLREDLDIFIK
jgi:hypothetical protein